MRLKVRIDKLAEELRKSRDAERAIVNAAISRYPDQFEAFKKEQVKKAAKVMLALKAATNVKQLRKATNDGPSIGYRDMEEPPKFCSKKWDIYLKRLQMIEGDYITLDTKDELLTAIDAGAIRCN